jgi:hypothetical protein
MEQWLKMSFLGFKNSEFKFLATSDAENLN